MLYSQGYAQWRVLCSNWLIMVKCRKEKSHRRAKWSIFITGVYPSFCICVRSPYTGDYSPSRRRERGTVKVNHVFTVRSQGFIIRAARSASSETQGLLVGTMPYFRASDILGWKFTSRHVSRAEEPLGRDPFNQNFRNFLGANGSWRVRKVCSIPLWVSRSFKEGCWIAVARVKVTWQIQLYQ